MVHHDNRGRLGGLVIDALFERQNAGKAQAASIGAISVDVDAALNMILEEELNSVPFGADPRDPDLNISPRARDVLVKGEENRRWAREGMLSNPNPEARRSDESWSGQSFSRSSNDWVIE